MTTYMISNAVTWIGLTSFQAGDQLIVTPGAAMVMPDASLSSCGVGAATAISFGGYVYLHDLMVDGDVSLSVTASGQFVSGSTGSAITLDGGHLDMAGQISAFNGTGVETMGTAATLSNSGRIAGLQGVLLGGTGASLLNSGTIEGAGLAVSVSGNHSLVTNLGTISSAGTAVAVSLWTPGSSFALVNSGHVQGAIRSNGLSDDDIRNAGTIVGNVSLGAGNDSYAGGNLIGNLSMGLGNDRVDARGTAISGIIQDAGGHDTYKVDSALTRIMDTGMGFDTVQAWCSFRLADGLEVLNLQGAANLDGYGNALANIVRGTVGDNRLFGAAGADTLSGAAGDDTLCGGFGRDRLMGGEGNDLLRGDRGEDDMTGGRGLDSFVFAALSDTAALAANADTITDFVRGADRIDLSQIDAISTNALTGDAFTFLGNQSFSHSAGEVRYSRTATDTYVELDVNGDGVADAVIHLTGGMSLTADDFIL